MKERIIQVDKLPRRPDLSENRDKWSLVPSARAPRDDAKAEALEVSLISVALISNV